MTTSVLDASAVLAVMNNERGADSVIEALQRGAFLSSVNYAEVITKLNEKGFDRETARRSVLRIGVQVLDFEIDLADRAGELRIQTKPQGLSLADRACLALAERHRLPALTADRKWATLDLGIDIRLIR